MLRGSTIASRYVLQHKLGAGGMGQVWAARHATTERMLAVKLILPDTTGAKVAKDRFMREARASARIGHANVIDVFDAGELQDGTLYLAMELLDGVSLGDALGARPPMALRDFLVAMADACRGLGAAHQVGIIHRDIKPENIFLHRERGSEILRTVVLDFGISKFLNNPDSATVAGSLLGSPRFMSPEQVRGAEESDARSDIWAVGVLLFRAMTGRWPHNGKGLTQLCVAIGSLPPANIHRLAPHMPEGLRQIVTGCLAPLEVRASDAAALADQLELAAADPQVVPLTVSAELSKLDSGITGDSLRVRDPSMTTTQRSQRLSFTGAPSLSHPSSQPPHGGAPSDAPEVPFVTVDSMAALGQASVTGSMVTPPPVAGRSQTPRSRNLAVALIGVVAIVLFVGGAGAIMLSGAESTSEQAAGADGSDEAVPPATSDAEAGSDGPDDIEDGSSDEAIDLDEVALDDEATGDGEATGGGPEPATSAPPKPTTPRPTPRPKPVVVAPPKPAPQPVPKVEPKPTPKPAPKPTPKPGVVGEDLGSGL